MTNIIQQNTMIEHNFMNYKKMNITTYIHKKKLKHKNQQQVFDQNPVYRLMKNEQAVSAIINMFMGSDKNQSNRRTHSSFSLCERSPIRNCHTGAHYESWINLTQKEEIRIKRRATVQNKFRSVSEDAKKVSQQVNRSKEKMKILDKYHNVVGKYWDKLPNPESGNSKETIKANEEIVQLCAQDFFPPKNDIMERARSMVIYRQPKVQKNKLSILKNSRKPSSILNPQINNFLKYFKRQRLEEGKEVLMDEEYQQGQKAQ